MNEPDTFIATITDSAHSFEEDMELPSAMPVSELSRQILMILKEIHADKFEGWPMCRLECNSVILKKDDTLITAGVFDGSRIVVREG
ncbi:MAG: EsaB/YukD family protein [Synergistaceae bacterium]|nr:EsaB/YukD family protein [Synergistaceae bacterium]